MIESSLQVSRCVMCSSRLGRGLSVNYGMLLKGGGGWGGLLSRVKLTPEKLFRRRNPRLHTNYSPILRTALKTLPGIEIDALLFRGRTSSRSISLSFAQILGFFPNFFKFCFNLPKLASRCSASVQDISEKLEFLLSLHQVTIFSFLSHVQFYPTF